MACLNKGADPEAGKILQHLDDRPEMKYLNRYVGALGEVWLQLGTELLDNKDVSALYAIRSDESKCTVGCSEMFKLWLERQPKASWRCLIKALKQINMIVLASNIERSLSIEPTSTGQVVSVSQNQSLLTFQLLMADFTCLLMRIREILSDLPNQSEKLEKCKEFFMYLKAHDTVNVPLFNPEKISEIKKCNDFKQLFEIVNQHLNWDEPDVLTAFIELCDSKKAEEELNEYKRKMAVSKGLEIINSIKSDPPQGFEKFCVVIRKSYKKLTLEKYNEIKSFIFENLEVRCHVTTGYISVLFDSLHLEWHVTMQAVPHMIKMAHEQQTIFINNDFIVLKIGKKDIIDMHTTQAPKEEPLQKESIHDILTKQLNKLVTSLDPKDQAATLSTLKRIFDNIVHYPNDDKYRQIKLSNKKFSNEIWQYSTGKELMKMSGWVVEYDFVRLQDDSHIHVVVKLLNQLCALPTDNYEATMEAAFNGDTATIKKLVNLSAAVSITGKVHFQNGSSISLLKIGVTTHNLDIVNLLVKAYFVDIYIPSEHVIAEMFDEAPESFNIEVLKVCGLKMSTTHDGFTILHMAVLYNCLEIVRYLIAKNVDVNDASNRLMYTPLHCANICDHKDIAYHLSRNGADIRAKDYRGRTPLSYIGGDPNCIKISQYIQNKQAIHMKPYSEERLYYLKLRSSGIDDETAVSGTIEQFPLLKQKQMKQTLDTSNDAIKEEIAKHIIDITPRSTNYAYPFLSAIA